MATLIRMNAWTPKQWELILSELPQNAGLWNIDWSDDKSDCES